MCSVWCSDGMLSHGRASIAIWRHDACICSSSTSGQVWSCEHHCNVLKRHPAILVARSGKRALHSVVALKVIMSSGNGPGPPITTYHDIPHVEITPVGASLLLASGLAGTFCKVADAAGLQRLLQRVQACRPYKSNVASLAEAEDWGNIGDLWLGPVSQGRSRGKVLVRFRTRLRSSPRTPSSGCRIRRWLWRREL